MSCHVCLEAHRHGSSVGVILSRELLGRLGVQKGDTLHAVDGPDSVRLTTGDPAFEAQMEEARRLMKRRRPVSRELAK